MLSDQDSDGPAEYSDDEKYDGSKPDRSSIVSTGVRHSKQYRDSKKSRISSNNYTLFGEVSANITQLIQAQAQQEDNNFRKGDRQDVEDAQKEGKTETKQSAIESDKQQSEVLDTKKQNIEQVQVQVEPEQQEHKNSTNNQENTQMISGSRHSLTDQFAKVQLEQHQLEEETEGHRDRIQEVLQHELQDQREPSGERQGQIQAIDEFNRRGLSSEVEEFEVVGTKMPIHYTTDPQEIPQNNKEIGGDGDENLEQHHNQNENTVQKLNEYHHIDIPIEQQQGRRHYEQILHNTQDNPHYSGPEHSQKQSHQEIEHTQQNPFKQNQQLIHDYEEDQQKQSTIEQIEQNKQKKAYKSSFQGQVSSQIQDWIVRPTSQVVDVDMQIMENKVQPIETINQQQTQQTLSVSHKNQLKYEELANQQADNDHEIEQKHEDMLTDHIHQQQNSDVNEHSNQKYTHEHHKIQNTNSTKNHQQVHDQLTLHHPQLTVSKQELPINVIVNTGSQYLIKSSQSESIVPKSTTTYEHQYRLPEISADRYQVKHDAIDSKEVIPITQEQNNSHLKVVENQIIEKVERLEQNQLKNAVLDEPNQPIQESVYNVNSLSTLAIEKKALEVNEISKQQIKQQIPVGSKNYTIEEEQQDMPISKPSMPQPNKKSIKIEQQASQINLLPKSSAQKEQIMTSEVENQSKIKAEISETKGKKKEQKTDQPKSCECIIM